MNDTRPTILFFFAAETPEVNLDLFIEARTLREARVCWRHWAKQYDDNPPDPKCFIVPEKTGVPHVHNWFQDVKEA